MSEIRIEASDGKLSISLSDNKALNLNDDEVKLASTIIAALVSAGINKDRLDVVRKSNDYATIVHRGKEWDSDLARFKYTPRAKWVSVPIPESKVGQLKDSPMFAAQKNKKQLLWKSKIAAVDDAKPLAKIAYEYLVEVQAKFPEYR